MDHISYNKIEENASKWSNNYKKIKKWCVCEKVHGSNFSFIWNKQNEELKYASRTFFIKDNDNFFNYKSILEVTNPKIYKIVELLLNKNKDINQVIVFGELFGGIYPKQNNNNMFDSNYLPVQKGVYYSPNIHFIAFDINIIVNNDKPKYLDFLESMEYFKQVDLLYTEPLAIFDNYEKASQYKLGFNSTIPKKLGLYELKVNKAEGVVIRSLGDENNRYIVKNKIPEFAESEYYDNTINTNDKKLIGLKMITDNRLNNAISKIGLLDEYRYQIYEMVCQDIINELDIKDNSEKKQLRIYLMKEIENKFNI